MRVRRGLACWATPSGDVATRRSIVTALIVMSAVTANTTTVNQGRPTHNCPVYQAPMP
jgi:hypothetical protein